MIDIHAIHAAAYSVAVDGEDFRFLDANKAALELTGFTTAFQPGLAPHDLFVPELAAAIVDRFRACCAGEAVSYVASAASGTGTPGWRTTLFPVRDPDRTLVRLYGICSPLAEPTSGDLSCRAVPNQNFPTQGAAEAALVAATPAEILPDHLMPALALEALDGGFWTLDLATREFRTSRRLAEKIAGPGHDSLNFAEYVGFIHVDDLSLEMPGADSDVCVEFRIFTFEGRMRWLQTQRRPFRDASGHATHVVGAVLDITDQKLELLRLEKEAATDTLTRVGNRRAFDRAAGRWFDDETGHRFGVVVLDLDGFKPVNDRHGHAVGDELLREAGRRLARLVAPGDLLTRVGGDEFAILMPEATEERIEALARRIEREIREPFHLAHAAIVVGASCGGAIRMGCDRNVGDVVARADEALYAAKGRHRRLTA